MVNLLPALSLKMQSYPECIWEVSTRYKSTAAESRMRSTTVLLFTLCIRWRDLRDRRLRARSL